MRRSAASNSLACFSIDRLILSVRKPTADSDATAIEIAAIITRTSPDLDCLKNAFAANLNMGIFSALYLRTIYRHPNKSLYRTSSPISFHE